MESKHEEKPLDRGGQKWKRDTEVMERSKVTKITFFIAALIPTRCLAEDNFELIKIFQKFFFGCP